MRAGEKTGPIARSGGGPATRLCGLGAGTALLTPGGYRPVESLRSGDLVGALIGRGPIFVPIAWVGRRSVQQAGGGRADGAPLVRIRRHAVAARMPNRDVLLAPDHAIYLDGALYLVRHLVNHGTILFDTAARKVEYWGIQLERHDLLLAENLPVESLLPQHAAAFDEVRTPYLRVVGGGASQVESGNDQPTLDFPAGIRMSARWFRRRFLHRAAPVHAPAEARPALPAGHLAIEDEIRAVLETFAGLMAQRQVRVEFAVEAGLSVRMDRQHLRNLLAAMLTHAIHAAPGARVLIGAMMHAGRVQVAVIDEVPSADKSLQQDDLQPAMQMAAMQGASLEVDARPGEGTTLLLRLLAP